MTDTTPSTTQVGLDYRPAYLPSGQSIAGGGAPSLQYKLLSQQNGVTWYVIVMYPGDEIVSGLTSFMQQMKIHTASFKGIGAIANGVSGWATSTPKGYKLNYIDEQSEIVSFIGDVATYNNAPVVHIHFTAAGENGNAQGGHMMRAMVHPTLEVFLTAFDTPLYKAYDPRTNMVMIEPELSKLDKPSS